MTAAAPPEAPEAPTPPPELSSDPTSDRTVSKRLVFTLIAVPTALILLTMSGVVGPILREGQPLWRLPYLIAANTPSGGDMGAHVLFPKEMLEQILPTGRILGWSMDWYAGFPAMYFYFPLPALTTVALDLVLPYGVAFKLVTIVGLVALPAASYFFVRSLGFTRFVSAVAAGGGSLFVFMESYSIFGANIKSTLAGEFSFSWSFALSIVYVGLALRAYRQGRKLDVWAGIVLGLTALAHIITTIVAVFVVLPLVLSPIVLFFVDRDRARQAGAGAVGVMSSWVIGFGLSAFWALALGVNVLAGMTTDMGWHPVTTITGARQAPGSPIPGELVPILVIGLIGILWIALRRRKITTAVSVALLSLGSYMAIESAGEALLAKNGLAILYDRRIVILVVGVVAALWVAMRIADVGIAIWLTLLPLFGYFLIAYFEFTILYNARLLPYWYFGIFIFAGIAIALFSSAVGRRFTDRHKATVVMGTAAVVLMGFSWILSMHDLPGWVKWDYEGYEGKDTWEEYENLMQTIDQLPPGRVMWETNSDQNRYGTPMALMLIPFWSEGHPTMEGVFFESSLTTPFHFLNSSEVSSNSSRAVRGLAYRPMNFDRAVKHLPVYNIDYYVSFTEEATEAATAFGLKILAEPEPWTIYELPESNRIDVAAMEPVVWAGDGDFVEAALDWYDDVDNLDSWLVEDGPPEWRRVTDVAERLEGQRPYDTVGAATVTKFENHTVSFTTDAVGVPHLVKVSYFPNWAVDGAEGVYRVAPSLMLVIPTQTEVTLQFEYRWVEYVGMALTAITVIGLAAYGATWAYRRKKVSV